MTRRSGFTLTELVMVITLTLILTSLSIKGLSGINTWRARGWSKSFALPW